MITRADLDWWLELEPELDWRYAVTYANSAPHEYVAAPRTDGLSNADFVRAAHVIQTFGEPMKFWKRTRIYLTTPMGWKHWTMDSDLSGTRLVNRGLVQHVYGVQNAPRTNSGLASPYDSYASSWDAGWGMSRVEREQTAALIREVFGDNLGRTLDVGCGSGWPIAAGLVAPVRYVGVDPSTAMLNALVAAHGSVAALHPMTWHDAVSRRLLGGTTYDSVLSLGGAASYLGPADLAALQSRSARGALTMHWAPDERPCTDDLDPDTAARSLAAASLTASAQTRIGRFIASLLPPLETQGRVR